MARAKLNRKLCGGITLTKFRQGELKYRCQSKPCQHAYYRADGMEWQIDHWVQISKPTGDWDCRECCGLNELHHPDPCVFSAEQVKDSPALPEELT